MVAVTMKAMPMPVTELKATCVEEDEPGEATTVTVAAEGGPEAIVVPTPGVFIPESGTDGDRLAQLTI